MRRILSFVLLFLIAASCDILKQESEPVISFASDQPLQIIVTEEGGSYDIPFTSALAWTAEIVYLDGSDGWASVSAASGEGGDSTEELTVNVIKNDTEIDRLAKLVITSMTKTAEITFVQDAHKSDNSGDESEKPIFRLSSNEEVIDAEGGAVQVVVLYNVEYEYKIAVDWIKEVESKASVRKTHTFAVMKNPSEEPRSTTISFCANETCIPFTISQSGADLNFYLDVDKANLSITADGTSSPVLVKVSSNVDWTVTSDSDWCVLDTASGSKNGSFGFTVEQNTLSESRTANITISSESGPLFRSISVIQSPVYLEGEDEFWKSAEFHHSSLALRFTADWCGYCPMMAESMTEAQKRLPGKLEVVSVHSTSSGLASPASGTLTSYFGIRDYPTGVIDARTVVGNYSVSQTAAMIVAAVQNTEATYDTYTSAIWTSSVLDGKLNLDLTAYIKKSGSYKVTAFLVEDKIRARQADYIYGDKTNYEHNSILRASLSDPLGDPITVEDDMKAERLAFSTTIPSQCKVDNLRVVVYIQRLDPSRNSYYVDNAFSAPAGSARLLEVASDNVEDGDEE